MEDKLCLHYFKVFHRNRTIFEINLSNEFHLTRSDLLSSVIIGANGTGKSYLLANIVELFIAINGLQKKRKPQLRYEKYTVSYSIGQHLYTITINANSLDSVKVNNQKSSIIDVVLPKKILAVSYLLNDKFPFRENDQLSNEIYEYLGIRRTQTSAFTNSLSEKISEVFLSKLNEKTINKINDVLSFLDFDSEVTLVFTPENSYLFSRTITYRDISTRISKLKKTKSNISNSIVEISQKDILDLVTFINKTTKTRKNIYYDKLHSLIYSMDFNSSTSLSYLLEDRVYLNNLIKLQFIKTPTILLLKNKVQFEIEQASSGEKHMLFTLLNIASTIESNSIVLIDEPDLSLHPNWQMKYIKSVKRIFKEYSSCHFILATHSHYLVSDLEPESSSLIVFQNNEDGSRSFELLNINTYAWSAENILYNIFNVRTTRNYYFEMDLREILELIRNKSDNFIKINSLLEQIKKVVLDKNDPLNLIIYDVERYLKNETNK